MLLPPGLYVRSAYETVAKIQRLEEILIQWNLEAAERHELEWSAVHGGRSIMQDSAMELHIL